MNKELLLIVDTVSNEKNVSKDMIFSAMEEALSIATKKKFNVDAKIVVKIDKQTGSYNTFRQWHIVNEDYDIDNYDRELYVDIAKEKGYKVKSGDILEEPIESIIFSRIAAMVAKQIITNKVNDEKKRILINKFKNKIGKIVYGEVKSIYSDVILVDLGSGAEGFLYKKEILLKDKYFLNDRVRSCVLKIENSKKGDQIILTRVHKKMLKALLELEIPEISEELIDIINISRDPGSRSKVSVKSNDKRIDPVGSCIGMRGSRIQAIINELHGERIDIILWDNNPAQYMINAIAPAEVTSIVQDEDSKSMQVAVKEDQLSQAIGKNGQNVRLASILTGWHINIMPESLINKQQKKELKKIKNLFIDALDIDYDISEILVRENFTTLEELAYINKKEILKIKEFDEDLVKELQERAKTSLISKALLEKDDFNDLMKIKDMNYEWAKILYENGIVSVEDLANLDIVELKNILPIDENKVSSLIMSSRMSCFNNKRD